MNPTNVRSRRANISSLRQKMWQSMRIKKKFTIFEILITVPGSTLTNAYKYFGRLEKAEIISKIGGYVSGRSGEQQGYVLLKDVGPVMPVLSYGKGSDVPQILYDSDVVNTQESSILTASQRIQYEF